MKIYKHIVHLNSGFLKQVLKGTAFLTLGSVISRSLLAVAYIILARTLTTSEYGEYGMIKSTIDNFLIFASMGIGLTTTKYISELKVPDKQSASSILGTALLAVLVSSLTVFFILYLSSDYLSLNVLENRNLKYPLIVGGVVLMFVALNAVQIGALLGLQSYKEVSIVGIIQGLVVFAGLCLGARFGGVMGAIIGNLVAMIILVITTHVILKKECSTNGLSVSFKNFRSNLKIISKFALPASLSSIVVAPTIWILNTMLIRHPNGYSELGIYNAVIIFSLAIQMINGSLSNVLLPIFLSKKTNITYKKEFFNYFGAFYISIFLALPLILYPELVSYILGDKYSIDIIKMILGFSIISALANAFKQGIARDLVMKNRMWLSVFSMGQWAITSLVVFYYLRDWGAAGFALSFCVGYIANVLLFIPFFILKKISPSYIFFNKWVVLIWVALLLLISLHMFVSASLISMTLCSMIIIVFLFLLMIQLYRVIALKKNRGYENII